MHEDTRDRRDSADVGTNTSCSPEKHLNTDKELYNAKVCILEMQSRSRA